MRQAPPHEETRQPRKCGHHVVWACEWEVRKLDSIVDKQAKPSQDNTEGNSPRALRPHSWFVVTHLRRVTRPDTRLASSRLRLLLSLIRRVRTFVSTS